MKHLANITTDGVAVAMEHNGCPAILIAQGAFDGATVALQVSADGENYVGFSDSVELSAPGAVRLGGDLPFCMLRLNASGSGGSTDIDIYLVGGLI